MGSRFPSTSTAFPYSRGGSVIRKRSGQGAPSPVLEDKCESSSSQPYSLSPLVHRPITDVSESDCTDAPLHSLTPELTAAELGVPSIRLLDSQSADFNDAPASDAELDNSTPSTHHRTESSLFPLPEEFTSDSSRQVEKADSLMTIPLTPRPKAVSRFHSENSHISDKSRRSIRSLFSRLPTPDFTLRNHNALQGMAAPLNFFRPRSFKSLYLPGSRRSSARPVSSKFSGASGSGSGNSSETLAEHLPDHRDWSYHTKSLKSGTESSRSHYEDELYPFSSEEALSRFKYKYPSRTPNSSFGRPVSGNDVLMDLLASENENDLGVEGIRLWTGHKWCLLVSVLTVFGYALTGLVYSISVWFGTPRHADVIWVADNDIIIFITLGSALSLFTGLVGFSGTLLNSRPILAFYALLLWPSFLSILLVGYSSYKREAFSLDRKLSMAWSQWYNDLGRLLVQDSLHCCGFYNPLHEATFSDGCYPRTPLPGCKGRLYRFEKENLRLYWRIAFSLVPLHILNILVSLLCSNHIDRRFGKGLTPRAYRLRMAGADAVVAQIKETEVPSEPSRSFSHVTDRDDRPATSRMPITRGNAADKIERGRLRIRASGARVT